MVIAAIKPGISSPSTLIDRVDLSIETTLPVKLYRFTLVSFASVGALASVPVDAVSLALLEGPQAIAKKRHPKAIALKIAGRAIRCISNANLTVLLLCLLCTAALLLHDAVLPQ